ncbi:porphyrin biosynthesis protein [Xenorhabdus sp. KJ12.1]|nr:AAA family ATPase [Xenorhabdus sp. KJ12.1]PHM69552.1 porphyrin biosynthesis protein [Xenorhabdus sp. KJ12.1]
MPKETDEKKIAAIHCALCGKPDVMMKRHFTPKDGEYLCSKHPTYEDNTPMNPDDALTEYKRLYPNMQTISPSALEAWRKKQEEKLTEESTKVAMSTTADKSDTKTTAAHSHHVGVTEYRTERVAVNEVLGLPTEHLCNALGKPIVTEVFINRPFPEFVPEVKESYVFNDIELIKDTLMMFTTGMPGYLWGHAGTGKAQPIDTIIPTPDGMKRFGDLRVGDKVFGSDGKPTSVVGIFPQGIKPMFRVIFRDGASTRACKEHLWTTLPTHEYKRGYKQKPMVRTTQEMLDAGIKHATGHKFKIPLVEAVEWPEKEHFIHPYILGVMIGDGGLLGTTPVISLGAGDLDIKSRVDSLLPEGIETGGVRVTSKNGRQFSITDNTIFHGNRIKKEIVRLGLNVYSGNKFIPEQYLFDSRENRLELLRGLMDTDGTCRSNRTGFSTTSRKLAEGIKFLVQSLGGTVIVKEYEKAKHKSGYYAEINVKTLFSPFHSTRKLVEWSPSKKNPPSRFITSIDADGEAECMCIKVAAEDSLYVTEEFIVTHNTTLPTQIAARLGRPLIRSQHTASTEESHITGQILAKDGRTYFEPGLLTLAMKHGFIYLADEYDFAYPQILSLYQPVLEGEPLILKEATPEWRKTTRHKHFAFVATGNTNGSGDETGLYQGTNQQNAANYSRFALVSKVEYMPEAQEILILVSHGIPEQMAKNLVKFAKRCRDAYEAHEVSQPIGPRELLNAGIVGVMRNDPVLGLQKSYINKLPSASAVATGEFAQRIFGKAA